VRVALTGASGFIATALAEAMVARGWEVVGLTRSGGVKARGVQVVVADYTRPGPWQTVVGGCDAVVNLAGASIMRRWSSRYKQLIASSRIETTARVAEALGPGKRLVSASAVGYYGSRGDERLTEEAPPGDDFLSRVCLQWERAAVDAADRGGSVAVVRLGVVLGRGGGALGRMLGAFRAGLGMVLGDGRQWMSWVHMRDVVEAVMWLVENPRFTGPFNLVAPNPVTNAEFTRVLAQALGTRPRGRMPAWVLRLVMGEGAEVMLASTRAVPARLLAAGYRFRFPEIDEALAEVVGR